MKSISSLQSFNIINLSIKHADKVKKYVTKKPHCFNKSNVERTNANLVKILEFVKAVLKILNLN